MVLSLPGQWVWDSWFVFDGKRHHAFYLQASRALQDPERRHHNVSIGHSVSDDLKNWQVLPDALIYSDAPAIDDFTTWTGSVIRDEDGLWWMFYTARTHQDGGERQTVAAATSEDLITWTKRPENPVLTADPEWYQTLAGGFTNEPFRDPWVFKLGDDRDWTMLITANTKTFEKDRERGVLAVAKSADLINWMLMPPQGGDQGFGEAEVFQYEIVDGVPILLFCCSAFWLSDERKSRGETGGVYSIPVNKDLSAVDFNQAVLFDDPTLYASRLVQDQSGQWNLIAFVNYVDGKFVGELCDPIPVTADPKLGLVRRS